VATGESYSLGTWIKRHKVLTGVVATVVLIVIIAVAAGGGKKHNKSTVTAGQTTPSTTRPVATTARPTTTPPTTAAPTSTAPPATAAPTTPPPTTAPPTTAAPTTVPPPTTAAAAAAASSQTCTVTLSNYNPPDYSDLTAQIQSNVPDASVTLSKVYKTTTSSDTGVTNAAGDSSINFYDSGATIGYRVVVTATVGQAQCETSFTPS
jgi:hypothetical protein